MRILRLLALASSFVAASAAAQSTQVWVSGTGDDTNTGTRTAPLLSFAAGLAAIQAGGEVDALDPGQDWAAPSGAGDWNTLVITQAATLDGHTGNSGYHALGSIVVNAGPSDVVILRNLIFDGSVSPASVGIQFNSGAALHLEHCIIKNFQQGGVIFAPAAAAQLFVSDSRIENVDTGAVSLNPAVWAGALIARSFLNSSGIGLAADGNSQVTLVDTALQSNATGISANAQHSQVDINLQGGSLADSSVGVESLASTGNAVVRLDGVTTANLDTPARKTGAGEVLSFRTNVRPSDAALCFVDGYDLSPEFLPQPPLVGLATHFQPALSQASGDITLTLASGTLPAGLALSGNSLTGTPTQSGNVTFALTATDAHGCQATRQYVAAIPAADFTLAAINSNVTTLSTQAVNANFLLMPFNGVLADDITLSCDSASGVTCSFGVNPAHLAPGGTPVGVTLTPGATFAAHQGAGFGGLLGVMAFGICFGLRDRRALRRLLILLALGLTACSVNSTTGGGSTGGSSTGAGSAGSGSSTGSTGGGTSTRPSRDVTVTLTATSAGRIVHTADVHLTVNYR